MRSHPRGWRPAARFELPIAKLDAGIEAGPDAELAERLCDLLLCPDERTLERLRRAGLGASARLVDLAQLCDRMSVDVACVVTAHPEVDYDRVMREAPLVVDLRGITRGLRAANLVRL
jgi:hypothetical protein